MTDSQNQRDPAVQLRQQAEERLVGRAEPDIDRLRPDETRRLIHELRVHQIELELQNEELRCTQTELDASRARYKDLYEFAPVGYCTISEKGLILQANLTAATLLNVARGTLVKQPISQFILKKDQDIYYLHRKQLFETGTPQVCELRMLRADNPPFWAQMQASATVDENGAPVACRVMLSDITDRKQMEDALREHDQQLRHLNAQKDKFFSILAHDLKNPLVGFLSFAGILEQGFDGMDAAERTMFIQHFRTSAESLFALLENLLTWARLQHGQEQYIQSHFPLDLLVTHAVDLLTPNAEQKQITLIHTGPSVEVYANVTMADTIVRNLIGNAIKFTPPGGTVTITTSQEGHEIRMTVADTGIGIPPDKLAQLFRIDGRTQRDGTNGEKGTGLGLILCKEFVEKQGGQIRVESEVGKGTTFTFTLPARQPCQG
jgi:PAS domain S-box-containing protein